TKINYPSSSFDVITVLDVIEHVPNIDKALSELRRVCRNGGLIVFTMPVYDGITGKIVNIMDKDITHVNKFSRHKWLDIIGKRVEIIEWQGIIRYFFMKKHYLHIQTIFLRKACPAILIICKNNK
ncbi:MAG: class I SAM-dependent methyltransferase, partial [Candidatus Woesearchaeota archaeon]|nr:class I SAM-dependent methyltransferase [Candidatus Woesearchaeota archaeon]